MTFRQKAQIVADRCKDAYSAQRYNSWTSVAEALLRRGFTPVQTEAIMRSKLMRWAADSSYGRYGKHSANDILRYLDKYVGDEKAEADELIGETWEAHEIPEYPFE